MKTQNITPAMIADPQNPLMWLKRNDYQQKSCQPSLTLDHQNLAWLKVDGSLWSNLLKTHKDDDMYEKEFPVIATVYQQMKVLKAKREFYFNTVTMMMVFANLSVLGLLFNI